MSRKNPGDFIGPLAVQSIRDDRVEIPHTIRLTHLQFRRFAGCPMCNLHIQSFIHRYDDILANGIQTIAIFHSSKKAMIDHHSNAPFPLIADPEKKLYKQFGVESSFKSILSPKAWPSAVKGLVRHGLRLPEFGESVIGLPADFLIDTHGRVLASQYGTHAYDQWTVDELLILAQR